MLAEWSGFRRIILRAGFAGRAGSPEAVIVPHPDVREPLRPPGAHAVNEAGTGEAEAEAQNQKAPDECGHNQHGLVDLELPQPHPKALAVVLDSAHTAGPEPLPQRGFYFFE